MLLITRQALPLHFGPGHCIGEIGRFAGNERVFVPEAAIAVSGDVAVGEYEVESAVVVEVTELRAPAPAAARHSERVGEVLIGRMAAGAVAIGHPEIVVLVEQTRLRDVADVDGASAVVEDVAKGDIHAALGFGAEPSLFADLDKALAVL